jgi:hypothetical protein
VTPGTKTSNAVPNEAKLSKPGGGKVKLLLPPFRPKHALPANKRVACKLSADGHALLDMCQESLIAAMLIYASDEGEHMEDSGW